MRGTLEGDTAAAAVCDSLVVKPGECKDLHKVLLKKVQRKLKFKYTPVSQHKETVLYLVVVTIASLFLVVAYIAFKKLSEIKLNSDLDSRINQSLQ